MASIEVFYMDVRDFVTASHDTWMAERTIDLDPLPVSGLTDCSPLEGWYYWYCSPGCLPDSEAMGPFTTEQEAVDSARHDDKEED